MQIRELMWHNVSIVRDAAGLARATAELRQIADQADHLQAQTKSDRARIIELRSGIDCALVITQSAAFREESRGAHWRADYPETSPAWLGSTFVRWPKQQSEPSLEFRAKRVAEPLPH